MKLTIKLCLLSLVVIMAGCGSNRVNTDSVTPELTYKKQAYVIGISDQLTINVWRNPEFSSAVLVRPDGFITIPLVGDVRAEDRTPEMLASVITEGLKRVIKSPEVTVTVTNPISVAYQYRVRILGQINNPVSVAFVEGMTVMDLVLAAGGVGPYGAPNRAVLNRLSNGEYQSYNVKLGDIFNDGDITTNYLLQPSDVITVPEKSIWRGEF